MLDDAGDPKAYHARTESPLDDVPQRVISLVPSLTESLFDLDLGDRLIAITTNCTRPTNRVAYLPRVGGAQHPDIAQIVALRPDVVLMDAQVNWRADVEALQAAGLPVWVTGPRTVFDVLNMLWALMDLFDHAVMVPRVREIERAYDYTLAASRAGEPIRVFVPTGSDPWRTLAAGTYPHDVLRVCGGDARPVSPAAEAAGEDGPITLADVVAVQPDVVLLPDDAGLSEADAAALAALDMPAAHTGRIHLIDGSLLSWHGTRVAYALRDLPALLMRKVAG